ncbi:hypothetical protein [Clostridium grantii]|uniref:Short C-terminal domain-containing protein n=1 Tax=Clostridium grantii DSM 8605 TaxID=1121316 RepID=A0A1M5UPH4_9CLOT|nr:hypothetical protein [Clostridium grantii]SHH64864.1 hypothetical protein SAMN02745207_01865 [Clostridium grantii DSM 8605]
MFMIWILIAVVFMYLIKEDKINLGLKYKNSHEEDPYILILKNRLAKGEIEIEEYELKKRIIENKYL